jgi:Fe(3+) dicitrate transport protein
VTVANPFGSGFPASTTLGYEEFNNGGVDLRARVKWGEGTMFRGSALTFGGVVYHGDAPFQRYTLNNTAGTPGFFGPGYLYAPRGSTSAQVILDQDRSADYQAFFIENVFRLGKFHIVPSFRLDHESVDVDARVAPYYTPGGPGVRNVSDRSADKLIPLWGIGLGNDFAGNNETYFSASSGWRPTRFFDIAGTTRAVLPGQDPDPFRSLDIELGVHGTPIKGFWYDVGLFWMEFENRTETQGQTQFDTFIVNTGSTRHRGFEGEVAYDFLAPIQLIVFGNVQLLDAEFTESGQTFALNGVTHSFVGNAPAYAPDVVFKGGISFKRDKCFNVTLTGVYLSDQYWQDSNQPGSFTPATLQIPAKIPSYTIYNLSAEFYLTKNARLFGGISNLSDEKYYSRVFPFGGGSIDPAPGRSGHIGLSVSF